MIRQTECSFFGRNRDLGKADRDFMDPRGKPWFLVLTWDRWQAGASMASQLPMYIEGLGGEERRAGCWVLGAGCWVLGVMWGNDEMGDRGSTAGGDDDDRGASSGSFTF